MVQMVQHTEQALLASLTNTLKPGNIGAAVDVSQAFHGQAALDGALQPSRANKCCAVYLATPAT